MNPASGTRPTVAVLTGGIASGKTAVSDHFRARGIPVIDTDVLAREVVQPKTPALRRIVEEFGAEVLDPEGQLDRKRMRALVFGDGAKRAALEAIIHPAVSEAVNEQLASLAKKQHDFVVVVIPLLTETGVPEYADRVIVVHADEATRLRRLLDRDDISRPLAQAMIDAQASEEERLALADDVLDNDEDLEALRQAVDELLVRYGEKDQQKKQEIR